MRYTFKTPLLGEYKLYIEILSDWNTMTLEMDIQI